MPRPNPTPIPTFVGFPLSGASLSEDREVLTVGSVRIDDAEVEGLALVPMSLDVAVEDVVDAAASVKLK